MTRRACAGDLAVRSRRGLLTAAERVALDAHLSGCASCRAVLDLGSAFDVPDAPELDDGARIQRLARAAETWTRRGRAPRRSGSARALRRRVFVLVAACVVLCCGVAAAALGTGLARPWSLLARLASPLSATPPAPGESRPPSRALAAARVDGSSTAQAAGQEPAQRAGEPMEVTIPVEELARVPGAPRAAASRTRLSAAASKPVAEGAAELFREASDARRRGDDTAAVALYEKLQRRFASSPEAELSSVPLGEMLLAQSQPAAALAQFERPAGALGATFRPESLYGRARALAALGDEAGESRAWRQLLEEFPKCPYAEAARRHLEGRSSPGASGSP